MNIAQHIEQYARLSPEHPALVFEGCSFTYAELNQSVNHLAYGLRSLGVDVGDRVVLLLPNIPAFVQVYLAVEKLGAIAVALNTMLLHHEIGFILGDSSARLLVTTQDLRRNLPRDAGGLPVVIVDGDAGADIALARVLAGTSPHFCAVDLEPDSPAAILYTSGTTGFPKGATLSHGNISSNCAAKRECCGTRSTDRLLLFLPLFHCFGQNAVLNHGLSAGATVVLQRKFEPDATLRLIGDQGVTMFFGVPTIFILLLTIDRSPYNLRSVRYYFSGAAPMPVEIAQQWYAREQTPIYEGYGLTETSPFACYNHRLQYRFGSVGTPIHDVTIQIWNEEGQPVGPGELGEIVVRGPNVMLGYWNNPEATRNVLRDGWLRTGDLGKLDKDGYCYLLDRIKDMINVGGMKVYPAEVENVLYQHPAVAEAAVYGVPDPLLGEMVSASVVLKRGSTATEQQLVSQCYQCLASFKVPRRVYVVGTLPRNPAGKVLKRRLREEHARTGS